MNAQWEHVGGDAPFEILHALHAESPHLKGHILGTLEKLLSTKYGLSIASLLFTFVLLLATAAIFYTGGFAEDSDEIINMTNPHSTKEIMLVNIDPFTLPMTPERFLPMTHENTSITDLLETLHQLAPQNSYNNAAAINAMSNLPRREFHELVATGLSNSRPLIFSLMTLPPGKKFRLHAHPNLEVILCVRGRIHEIRMTKNAPPVPEFDVDNPVGPDLSQPGADFGWTLRTLDEGHWLTNEVGSIHQTFTDNESGCTLFVLWSGKHANIEGGKLPVDVDLDSEVMKCQRTCCSGGGANTLRSDLFLPRDQVWEDGKGAQEEDDEGDSLLDDRKNR